MFKLKTHHYFWIACLFFVVLWFYWSNSDDAIDININDTYYVIANVHIVKLLFVLYGFAGFIYWAFSISRISHIKILTKLHILITIGSVPVYFFGVNLIFKLKPESDFPLFYNSKYYVYFILILNSLILIAQLLFVINLVISTFKHSKSKS